MERQIKEWNLTKPLGLLGCIEQAAGRATMEREISELADTVRTLKNSPNQVGSIDPIFQTLLQVDRQLDSYQAAITLSSLSSPEEDRQNNVKTWLKDQCDRFSMVVEDFVSSVFNNRESLGDAVREWLRVVRQPGMVKSVQKDYQNIASRYLNRKDIGNNALLTSRFDIDPNRLAMKQQLLNNQLMESSIHSTPRCQQESQAYFNALLDQAGCSAATLTELRDIEEKAFAHFHFNLNDALTLIKTAFGEIDPIYEAEVNDLITEGRLRLLSEPEEPDLCLDTPMGSYIQSHFNGSLTALVLMAHEMGHAIHQRLHRESDQAHLPLTEVDSETWALYFENCLLNWLEKQGNPTAKSILAFRDYQRIEMNHRHRMLHAFEYALHHPRIRSESRVNELWLDSNRRFYGDRVKLDSGFESAWQEVHHFFTAPFYLMVYGVAKERADQLSRLGKGITL